MGSEAFLSPEVNDFSVSLKPGDEVAKRISTAKKIPEEKYEVLKLMIKKLFGEREYRKKYMKAFRNGIINSYKLENEDFEECSVTDIIEDLEKLHLLSKSSSDIRKFQQVFINCGCSEVVDYINSLENVRVEKSPVDATDDGVNTPFQFYPSGNETPKGIQEQNPGSSVSATGGGEQSGIHTEPPQTTGASSTTEGSHSSGTPAGQTQYTGVSPNAGYLPEEVLSHICEELGSDWMRFGVQLGIPWNEVQRIDRNFRRVEEAIMEMLMKWRGRQPHEVNQLDKMCQALTAYKNVRLAEDLRKMMKK